MIVGFKRFEAAFLPHRESFILIGGTAVQMVLGQYDSPKGFANRARVTHDIDILVVTDNLTDGFKSAFHKFIEEGAYECYFSKERPHYYRFLNPKNADYPNKIELLSHSLLDIPGIRYTPLSVERDESMSAMVLEEELYQYALAHCRIIHGFKCLKSESLIVFKIAAYLNLMEEYAQTGDARRRNDALKHRNDVFRILEHVAPMEKYDIPAAIEVLVREFISRFSAGGTNYLEWNSISQAISSPSVATNPMPLIAACNRLFMLS
jgi:hypothetical protein